MDARTERFVLVGLAIAIVVGLSAVLSGRWQTIAVTALVSSLVGVLFLLAWRSTPAKVWRRDRYNRWERISEARFRASWRPRLAAGFGAPDDHDYLLSLHAPFAGEHLRARRRWGVINHLDLPDPYASCYLVCGVVLPNGAWVRSDEVALDWGEGAVAIPQQFPSWPNGPDVLPRGRYRIYWMARLVLPEPHTVVLWGDYDLNQFGGLERVVPRWQRLRSRARNHWTHLRGLDEVDA